MIRDVLEARTSHDGSGLIHVFVEWFESWESAKEIEKIMKSKKERQDSREAYGLLSPPSSPGEGKGSRIKLRPIECETSTLGFAKYTTKTEVPSFGPYRECEDDTGSDSTQNEKPTYLSYANPHEGGVPRKSRYRSSQRRNDRSKDSAYYSESSNLDTAESYDEALNPGQARKDTYLNSLKSPPITPIKVQTHIQSLKLVSNLAPGSERKEQPASRPDAGTPVAEKSSAQKRKHTEETTTKTSSQQKKRKHAEETTTTTSSQQRKRKPAEETTITTSSQQKTPEPKGTNFMKKMLHQVESDDFDRGDAWMKMFEDDSGNDGEMPKFEKGQNVRPEHRAPKKARKA